MKIRNAIVVGLALILALVVVQITADTLGSFS